MNHSITVRQTIDPFVDDIQYIRSCEVALEPDGRLSMSKIGSKLGMLVDDFVVIGREWRADNPFPVVCVVYPTSDLLHRVEMQMIASYEDGPDPIFAVVERSDMDPGLERHLRRMDARSREDQIIYLKQLISRPWNWVAPIFSQKSSTPPISIVARSSPAQDLQSGNAVSTSVHIATTSRLVHRHWAASQGIAKAG